MTPETDPLAQMPDDFLSVTDLTGEQIVALLDLADELKAERNEQLASGQPVGRDTLRGQTVAMIFEKPSTRTRVSFQVAVSELGGHPLSLSSAELQLGRGETIADTGAVLSRYVQGIVVRTFGQERIDELAEAAAVPVVNALTDLEHPCQALADLQAFREVHGGFQDRTLTYVGDGNNVANSLLLAGALVGLNVRVGHPEGYAPDAGIVGRAQVLAEETGATIEVTTDPIAAVRGANAVYADVWTSMGQEDEADDRIEPFVPFRVTEELMAEAADDAIFLHCLPAHRGEEVTAEVIDGPTSRVFDQAENRLHAQKALLARLIT
jgi:ornithine carbamoyltransferase